MALYLVKLGTKGGRTTVDGVTSMIVEADDAAKAEKRANVEYGGDTDWTEGTPTAIAAGVASDYTGFKYRVRVSHATPGNPDPIDVEYTGVTDDTVDLIGVALKNALIGEALSAAIADDGGVFTDETSGANNDTVGDMTLLPATEAVNDAYYFGSSRIFNRLVVNVSTAGAGTYTIAWEYYNGSTWSALTGPTEDFSATGLRVVTWTQPTDWATTTINSQGPFYYVRARFASGDATTQPLATRAYVRGHTSAEYSTGSKELIVAKGGGVDDLGDRTLGIEAIPNGANASLSDLIGTITDKGVSTADLKVVLTVPTAIPAIMDRF